MASAPDSLRNRAFHLLEAHDRKTPGGGFVDGFLIVLILANAAAVTLETDDGFRTAYGRELFVFELISIVIFTIEYAARIWVAPEGSYQNGDTDWRARRRFMLSWHGIIDLLAILPFYLSSLLGIDLRMLRLLRLVRLFKLTRYSPALGTMWVVARNERNTIFGALCILVVLLVLSATLMYHLEGKAQPDAFGSIPAAMWWAMATLTTVGYGDVTPVTGAGRMVGSVVMLLGIGVFVLWTSVFAAGFMEETRKRNFVVTWRMVADVPIFSDLDARRIADIAELLRPETRPARFTVMRRGEPADSLYFVATGEVEVDFPDKVMSLGPGSFFGELGLLGAHERVATVTTLTECNLLRLESDDFHRLMELEPEIEAQITRVAAERLSSPQDDVGPDTGPENTA